MPIVTAAFHDVKTADRAVDELLAQGVSPDKISLMVSNSSRERFFPGQDGGLEKDTAVGGALGAVAGAGLGALAGGLLAGAITVATGGAALPLLVAGPLASGLAGTAVGTLVGGLVGAGVSEPVAHDVEHGVKAGALIVAVHTTDDADVNVEAVLGRYGGTVEPPTDGPVPPVT
jgi:hypothetical protein